MKKFILIKTFLVFGVILILSVIFSEPLLNGISRALVHEDPLVKVDAIVVLAGGNGNRIEAAARLYHEGFGRRLFFSGFRLYPGIYTSTRMKNYALKLGVPEDKMIISIPDVEVSTRGESFANLDLLKKKQVKNFILVTSSYHTRRAKLIYENTISLLEYEIKFLVYPAQDPYVPIQGWWRVRTAQKGVLFEYLKWIAYYFNL
jgi:uncharacterized SAM-binding protein YcdF (DUF218 family)